MMNCQIVDFPKNFTMNNKLDYNLQRLILRGAFETKGLSIFLNEVKINKKLIAKLKSITLSKDLKKSEKKWFTEAQISIVVDKPK